MEVIKQTWEYLKVIVGVRPSSANEGIILSAFDETLERLGEDGWEMVTAVPLQTHMGTVSVTLFFKRPKG